MTVEGTTALGLTRRRFIYGAASSLTLPSAGFSFQGGFNNPELGLPYLERIAEGAATARGRSFVAPSQIHPNYSHAIYVNCSTTGRAAQKMWVIKRSGSDWELALWDDKFWAGKASSPSFSWPVSTGRHYPGNNRAGPTPLGIFNVDERNSRHRRSWGSPGMYNSIYIDLHYSSGRISGVAMHGTTGSMYRRLGRADSHGCVRMTQNNADQVWRMFHPDTKPGTSSPLWVEAVPRYFKSKPAQSRAARTGYRRDGGFLYNASGEVLSKAGYGVLLIYFRDDLL